MQLKLPSAAVALVAAASFAPLSVRAQAWDDISVALGLVHEHSGGEPDECEGGRECALAFAGSVVAEDVNGDGRPDLYFGDTAGSGWLYLRCDAGFCDVTSEAGLSQAPASGGALWHDIDGDGDRDLILSPISREDRPVARPYVYVSDASARPPGAVPRFVERGEELGFRSSRVHPPSGMGIVAGDLDRDGQCDLLFTDWRDRVTDCGGGGARFFYGGDTLEEASTRLGLRDRLSEPLAFSFGGGLVDLDGDLVPELYVVGDFSQSVLLAYGEDGMLRDVAGDANVGTERTGMGSSFGDFDNDGDLDIFVSAIFLTDHPWDGNRLFRNDGGSFFH